MNDLSNTLSGTRARARIGPGPATEVIGWAVSAFALIMLVVAGGRARFDQLSPISHLLALGPVGHGALRGLTLASCIGLLLLSRGLMRGQRRAWGLGLGLLAVMALAVALHDDDQASALAAVALIASLLIWHRRFTALTDPPRLRATAGFVLLAVAALYAYGLAATWWYARAEHVAWRLPSALSQVSWGLVGQDTVQPASDFSRALTYTLAGAALLSAVILAAVVLRAPLSGVTRSVRDRATVRRLVLSHGADTLSYFALRRDKRHFINAERSAFLAYRSVSGVALVSGDPIGDEDAFPALVAAFAAHCRAHSWRLAVMGVAERRRALWSAIGLKTLPVGEEAVVQPERFSLEGRAVRKVRQSVNRLDRLGYTSSIMAAGEITPDLWHQIDAVSAIWAGGLPERGFSMVLDDMHDPEYEDCLFVLGFGPGGALEGFLHFAPVPATGDLSLSAMRRLPETPNGFNEFLIVRVLGWARERDIRRVSLNFAAFGGLLRADEVNAPARAARSALRYADRFFQLERLITFNSKFQPEWEPRYLAVERRTDVAVAGLVLLSLEGLVRLPGAARLSGLGRS